MSSTSPYTKEQLEFFRNGSQQQKLAQNFSSVVDNEDKNSPTKKPESNEPVPPLFKNPPSEKEKKTGRIKYVTDEKEKISYPLPPTDLQNGDKSMPTVALSYTLGNGNQAQVLYQNIPSNDIPSDVYSPFYNTSIRLQ